MGRVRTWAVALVAASAACGYHTRAGLGTDAAPPCATCEDGGADASNLPDAGPRPRPVCEGLCEGNEWMRLLEPSGGIAQWGRAVSTDHDGNVLVTASVWAPTYRAPGFAWLAKLSPAGEMLWDQAIPGMPAGAVVAEPDGEVVGISYSTGMDVRMLSAGGEPLWMLKEPDRVPADVAIARDGAVLVAANGSPFSDSTVDWALLRYERDGRASAPLAVHEIDPDQSVELVHGVEVVDDGILLVGSTPQPAFATAWVRKLDETGAVLWRRDYPEELWFSQDPPVPMGPVIGAAPDGAFALGGGVASDLPYGHDSWVGLYDREGEPLWAHRNARPDEGGEESTTGVAIDSHGLVVSGSSLWKGWERGFVASVRKFDREGRPIWDRTYEDSFEAAYGDDGIDGVAVDRHDAVLAIGTSNSGSGRNAILLFAFEASVPGVPEPPPPDCAQWLDAAAAHYGPAATAAVLWISPEEDSLVAFAPFEVGSVPLDEDAAVEAARLVLGDDFDPVVLSFVGTEERLVLWDRPLGARIAVFTPGGNLAMAVRQDIGDEDDWVTQVLEPSTWQLRGRAPLGLCPEVPLHGEGVSFEQATALPEDKVTAALSVVARTPIPNLIVQQTGARDVVATHVALDGNVFGDQMVVLWAAP